ncbi:MAG TPA: zinc-dependent peptidase [Spirochaetota bacterium]|nr:zinc-dependent peptidase [Spirochaetota bacterium]
MELLYTRRYKVNRMISFTASFLLAVATAGVVSNPPFGVPLAYNMRAFAGIAVFLFADLFFTRKYRRRKKILHSNYPSHWVTILTEHVYYFRNLDKEDQEYFLRKIQIFLEEVMITGVKMEIDDVTRLLVASAAIIPVFRIPDWDYPFLTDVFVCQDNLSDDIELLKCKDDVMGLVIYNKSSVYLSREQLIKNFRKTDGNNLGLHEFIHKIDEVSGDIDGILPPPFLSKKERNEWLRIVDNEMNNLKNKKSDLKEYALTSRAEFIAVAAEYFFEKPVEMKFKHPSLYLMMQKMFRQDLASAVSDEAKKIISR